MSFAESSADLGLQDYCEQLKQLGGAFFAHAKRLHNISIEADLDYQVLFIENFKNPGKVYANLLDAHEVKTQAMEIERANLSYAIACRLLHETLRELQGRFESLLAVRISLRHRITSPDFVRDAQILLEEFMDNEPAVLQPPAVHRIVFIARLYAQKLMKSIQI